MAKVAPLGMGYYRALVGGDGRTSNNFRKLATMKSRVFAWFVLLLVGVVGLSSPAAAAEFRSHPPTRPLPQPGSTALATGPKYFVDPQQGNDANAGTQDAPWQTIQHGMSKLQPGDTLYLRAGTYREHVTVDVSGTAEKPITIAGYPGELAIVDGGLPEFFLQPETAWEACPGGAAGEFRSTKVYPGLAASAGVNVMGNFGDSMVPLHGYRFLEDLRSDNPYWNVSEKVDDEGGSVYCGPGVWYDVESGRIHVRLAHTQLDALQDDNYRGETDPRKIPLVIAGTNSGSPVSLTHAGHVRLQDFVLRGARTNTLNISRCHDIHLDGLTVYGGGAPIGVRDTLGLRMEHTACRGLAAPWTFRGSLKYRSIESRLFSASGWSPTGLDSRDFEIAYCEFTDSVDGVFIGSVRGVRFHHNLIDNVSDDGIFLTATTGYDGVTAGGDVQIYQNRFVRCLTSMAFGVGHGRQKALPIGYQTGSGVYVYRNVFDFRRPVMYHWPSGPGQEITFLGRLSGDHGGLTWEPIWFYQNTVIGGEPPFRGYYGGGLATHLNGGTQRRVFNNIFLQFVGLPGQVLPEIHLPPDPAEKKLAAADKPKDDPLGDLLDGPLGTKKETPKKTLGPVDAGAIAEIKKQQAKPPRPTPPTDFAADGNLHWSASEPLEPGEFLKRFRTSKYFEISQKSYPAGWTRHDLFANPQLTKVDGDWHAALDVRPTSQSPVVNSGVEIPASWPDPLAAADQSKRDIGALPQGANAWAVGMHGRLDVAGNPRTEPVGQLAKWAFGAKHTFPAYQGKPVAIVQGYPAFDAPLIKFAFHRQGVPVDEFERTWVNPAEFSNYKVVAIDGSFTRAKIEPNTFSEAELVTLRKYLEDGGTLLLMRQRNDLFAGPHGQQFLRDIVGVGTREEEPVYAVQKPSQAWVKHLPDKQPEWLKKAGPTPLRTSQGEVLVGSPRGSAVLYRAKVGKGQLIYFGWSPAQLLPSGRAPGGPEDEDSYDQSMQVLLNIASELLD